MDAQEGDRAAGHDLEFVSLWLVTNHMGRDEVVQEKCVKRAERMGRIILILATAW